MASADGHCLHHLIPSTEERVMTAAAISIIRKTNARTPVHLTPEVSRALHAA
jgi:hypothetical protein